MKPELKLEDVVKIVQFDIQGHFAESFSNF